MTQMDTNEEKILYKDLSYKIIGLAMEVHTKLGYGFLEKVYENAMTAQTLNYLKATGLRLAIILNFGKEQLKYERFVQ